MGLTLGLTAVCEPCVALPPPLPPPPPAALLPPAVLLPPPLLLLLKMLLSLNMDSTDTGFETESLSGL